jgi:hypothetical protein
MAWLCHDHFWATDRARLLEIDDPVGPDNSYHLLSALVQILALAQIYGMDERTAGVEWLMLVPPNCVDSASAFIGTAILL